MSLPPRSLHGLEADPSASRWRGRELQPRLIAAVLAIIFFGLVGASRVSGHWQTNIPRQIYMTLVPHANEYGHQESLQ